MKQKGKTESEDLADRLLSLYQMYNCKNELPSRNDLVAKLESVEVEVCDATKRALDLHYVYPISYKEALQSIESSFREGLIMCILLTYSEGVEYASSASYKMQKKPNDFLLGLYTLYGGIKKIPTSVRAVFLTSKGEEAKELMKEHNRDAAQYFVGFKENLKHFLKT